MRALRLEVHIRFLLYYPQSAEKALLVRFRLLITAAAALIVLAASAASSSMSAAELQMYRRAGCPWCLAWDRDVGPIYGKTDIGRAVPLRMIDLDRERPKVVLKSPVVYTPTFVLVENGREVGRIEGYPGDSFFWGLLDRLVQQLDRQSQTDQSGLAPGAVERGGGT